MEKITELLPFLIPLAIVEFALLGYTLHHILTHKNYKRVLPAWKRGHIG